MNPQLLTAEEFTCKSFVMTILRAKQLLTLRKQGILGVGGRGYQPASIPKTGPQHGKRNAAQSSAEAERVGREGFVGCDPEAAPGEASVDYSSTAG